jgi:hypothetical protein
MKKPDNPVIPNQLRIGNPMLLTSGRRDSVRAGESLDDDRSLGIAARKCATHKNIIEGSAPASQTVIAASHNCSGRDIAKNQRPARASPSRSGHLPRTRNKWPRSWSPSTMNSVFFNL